MVEESDIVVCVAAPLEVAMAALAGWSLFRHRHAQAQAGGAQNFSAKQQFHAVVILALLVRASFLLGMVWYARDEVNLAVMSVWGDFAALLNWAAYLQLFFFWLSFFERLRREVAHHTGAESPFSSVEANSGKARKAGGWRGMPALDRARVLSYVAVVALMILILVLYALLWAFPPPGSRDDGDEFDQGSSRSVHIADTAFAAFFGVMGVAIATCILVAGFKNWQLLGQLRVASPAKTTQRLRIVVACVVISATFLVRAVISLASAFVLFRFCFLQHPSEEEDDKYCSGAGWVLPWYWMLAFFTVFEIFPFLMMVLLLRKNPQGDASGTAEGADVSSVKSPLLRR